MLIVANPCVADPKSNSLFLFVFFSRMFDERIFTGKPDYMCFLQQLLSHFLPSFTTKYILFHPF